VPRSRLARLEACCRSESSCRGSGALLECRATRWQRAGGPARSDQDPSAARQRRCMTGSRLGACH
jgi:hypothetical protein